MIRRSLLVLAAAAALAGCGTIMRVVYNNGDFALRVMANEYFDTNGDQEVLLRAQLARFHEWHRREELPAYARLFQSAAERAARGLQPEDVSWAVAAVRGRYRQLVAQAAADGAPVVASFRPGNYAALERKFAEVNAKFTREYLAGDQAKRDQARAKWFEERIEWFVGDLTEAQGALIQRFVQGQPRMNEVRLADRKRRQQEFAALIRKYQSSPELAGRMQEFFVHWERDRGAEHARLAQEWEERLSRLVVELDRTLAPHQRAHLVGRFESLAEDARVLAREGLPAAGTRAAALQ